MGCELRDPQVSLFEKGGVTRPWVPIALLMAITGAGALLADELHERGTEVENERREVRDAIRRIDERTERLERSCMEVCGD